jgi:hypothetical protein
MFYSPYDFFVLTLRGRGRTGIASVHRISKPARRRLADELSRQRLRVASRVAFDGLDDDALDLNRV